MKQLVRKPVQEDVEYLINNIREDDVKELDALSGGTIRGALDRTPDLLNSSQVWEVDGKVVCMFGITKTEYDKIGIIWLLATEDFAKYSKMCAIKCRKVFKDVIKGYDFVFNYVYSENIQSIKWLKWLGFTMCDAEPLGEKGANFHRFELTNV